MTSVRSAEVPSHQERESGAAVGNFLNAILAEVANLTSRTEIAAIERAADLIIACESHGGRVHLTGVGKPEHAARYAAALFSSTGTPAYFLHATECRHGSAGQLRAGDVVIAVSNSGLTAELLDTVEVAKKLGAWIIALSGDPESPLAELADVFLYAGVKSECDVLGLAPRASFIGQIVMLSALSTSLQTRKGLTPEQYAAWHPSGVLGRKAREQQAPNEPRASGQTNPVTGAS